MGPSFMIGATISSSRGCISPSRTSRWGGFDEELELIELDGPIANDSKSGVSDSGVPTPPPRLFNSWLEGLLSISPSRGFSSSASLMSMESEEGLDKISEVVSEKSLPVRGNDNPLCGEAARRRGPVAPLFLIE